ncbi:MAG TPA: hypothetical protein VGO88_03645 [Mycetocola sp.]|jgi:hypothetical protein|uniref:hypothetical protein n=1 Tax=Mycetocola sp. TaxID=1871042 RepID=UPI002622622F|nr:hypothetical protein [Mycetocola sp.]MCU1419375.1 hypothetical protein [Mycetocola sp.]MCU1560535.1 hypothetical protein [Mycetocola sp.]HEV7848405.1 hypothetical protein [Mycetocola sp.]
MDRKKHPEYPDEPRGPRSTIGERITGIRDPKDPDGLVTLNDLPDPTGDVSDLSALTPKTSRYGDDTAR